MNIIEQIAKELDATYTPFMKYPFIRTLKQTWVSEIGYEFSEDGTKELLTFEDALSEIEDRLYGEEQSLIERFSVVEKDIKNNQNVKQPLNKKIIRRLHGIKNINSFTLQFLNNIKQQNYISEKQMKLLEKFEKQVEDNYTLSYHDKNAEIMRSMDEQDTGIWH